MALQFDIKNKFFWFYLVHVIVWSLEKEVLGFFRMGDATLNFGISFGVFYLKSWKWSSRFLSFGWSYLNLFSYLKSRKWSSRFLSFGWSSILVGVTNAATHGCGQSVRTWNKSLNFKFKIKLWETTFLVCLFIVRSL
jgi:hypothetical protein